MSILASKKSNYNNTTEGDKLKDYLSDVDQDLQNLFQMSTPITFGYGSSNNILVSQGGWTWSVSGYLGGWNVTGNLLYAGTGSTYIGLQPGVGIWAGDEAFLNGAFSVDPNGVVKAHSGDIGGWLLSASRLYSTNILLDSSGEYIRTVNYASGALGAGWNIDNTLAEFNNIRARGKIVTSVFEKDTVSTVGGNLLVSDSDILNVDMVSSDTSNLTVLGDTTFAVGDFLRIRDGVDDEWFQVSAVSSNTYTVTRDKAGVYGTNLNPAWKKGTAVANFGTSGEGVIFMTASESNAPYLSIVTHAGSPWTTLYTQCRLGNLNGFMDYSTDKYGIAMGSGNANLTIDPANGVRIRKNLTDLVAIDTAGNAYISGSVRVGGSTGAYASTLNSWVNSTDVTLIEGGKIYAGSSITIGSSGVIKSGQTAYNVGTGWWLGDVSGTPKFSIGSSASAKTLTWDGTNLSVANVQSPDYAVGTSGYLLSATSGLVVNSGVIQGRLISGDLIRNQLFTSSGTFTAPTGVTVIYVTMCGGGGGGGGGYTGVNYSGGGGAASQAFIDYTYSVTPNNNYTVTIGTGGAGGTAGVNGGNGGNVIFDTLTAIGGSGGVAATIGASGAGGVAANPTATSFLGGITTLFVGSGASGTQTVGGGGGGSHFGTGGNGGNNNGYAGNGNGSGGGGAVSSPNGVGGKGADGFCLIKY